MKFGTKAIHAGVFADPTTGAVSTPIYQTSTYRQKSPGQHQGFEYSRSQNPTRKQLEDNLAALESGDRGLCFASGLAAVDAIMRLLKPGDEVLSINDLYGGTYRLFTKVFEPIGIKFRFLEMGALEELEAEFTDQTKMVWLETPTNPLMKIVDIAAISALAKSKGVWTAVDNTFATPYIQRPLELGADIVMHSATKYLGGHSDVVLGAIVTNAELGERLAFYQNAVGGICGPMDSYLTLRGIKTLHVRMKQHNENGMQIAKYLEAHPKVGRVYYPGLPNDPYHELAKRQMNGFGGMVSFELKDESIQAAFKVMEAIDVFWLAESLGGVESLCNHPATMTHASIPKEARLKAGLKDSLIRLSVGIEDVEDLIADLEQAIG